jgi:competence protein ComEC
LFISVPATISISINGINLRKIFDNIPFLRITAALTAGILSGSFLQIFNLVLYATIVLLCIILLWLNAHYKYNLAAFFGLSTFLIFFATGILVYNLFNTRPRFYKDGKFVATVQEILLEKKNSYQSVLDIHLFLRHDSIITTCEKVLVYFAKDDKAKALLPGQTILFNSSPQFIANNNNPFGFNYKRYMERRKIFRQIYLPSDAWMPAAHDSPFRISVFAEQLRMRMLNTYIQQDWNEQQLNVLSALTLGYKRGLDPEIKKTFASAGALHILAVSGLHVGILFLIINLTVWFSKKGAEWKISFCPGCNSFALGFCIYNRVISFGKKGCTMFTFVVVGQNLRRQINIYNTITASAFFLLLLNPNNLFEAGFQLSYAAVFGIVYLQPRFEKLLFFRLKL